MRFVKKLFAVIFLYKVTEVGGWQDEEKWEEVHDKVIDFSMRIKKAFDPIIYDVQKKY